jgi:iron complex transport system substrate-binding protein
MAEAERIVSFLPSATEMACALGLSDRLMGVSHECDYPLEVSGKPIVVRSALPIESMSQSEIDVAVSGRLKRGLSLYQVDESAVRDIGPDLILTQDLCQVCAPSGNEVSQLLAQLPSKPRILWQTPKTIGEIFDCIRELGEATGREAVADALVRAGRTRVDAISAVTSRLTYRPRVFCLEWMDPIYCSGHWVPEMVRIAGGVDGLGREGADSVRVSWNDVRTFAPEVLIVMPCGFDLGKTVAHAEMLSAFEGWSDIPAARAGRVYAVDANAYFSRPGPRVIEGTELLAHLIHPTLFAWNGSTAFRPLREMLESSRA